LELIIRRLLLSSAPTRSSDFRPVGESSRDAFLPKEQILLEQGGEVRGTFWIAGRKDTETAGVLRWSRSGGAELWLIDVSREWPGIWHGSAHSDGPLTIHGASVSCSRLTMPQAYLGSSSFGSGPAQLSLTSRRLILFRHTNEGDRWKRLVIRTSNLHEWMPITGFGNPPMTMDRRFRALECGVTWKVPRGRRVALSNADVRFEPEMRTDLAPRGPDRVIRTTMDIAVISKERKTLGELHEEFVTPLHDLLVIAGGVPDALLYESVSIGRQRPAVVLETGIDPPHRDWPRPDRQLLFYALDVPDFRAAIGRWFSLHARVSPALQYFAESINDGGYSPARLLSVASTLETYHRVLYDSTWRLTYKRKNPGQQLRGPSLLERVTHLQRLCGVPERITGFSESRRQLFVASRNHFAHLNEPRYGYSTEDVYDNAIPSIARGVALMHACLMRRLGFSARETSKRIELTHGFLTRQ
jgi:hypothetical protein